MVAAKVNNIVHVITENVKSPGRFTADSMNYKKILHSVIPQIPGGAALWAVAMWSVERAQAQVVPTCTKNKGNTLVTEAQTVHRDAPFLKAGREEHR